MTRVGAEAAEREFQAMGATPLEPFPGVQRPWRSVHDRCGREVSPTLGNARRRGSVCKYCAATDRGARRKQGLAASAAVTVRDAGWDPLESYPGGDMPWRVRHRPCQTVMLRSMNTIRSKPDSCMVCYRQEHGHQMWTAERAHAMFVEVGLTPLEEYPGSSTKPWRARHDECGREVAPRLGNVAARQGPCDLCGRERAAASHRSDSSRVEAELRAAGYEPTAPFESVDSAWPSIHLACGAATAPTLSNLRRGQGGCVPCGLRALSTRFIMSAPEARQVMLAGGLTPSEPYPGSARPWRCVHECGKEVTPTFSNVRVGRGICRYCNSAFPYDGPATVYLVADRDAIKIGCAARGRGRVAEHLRHGWQEAWQVDTLTGDGRLRARTSRGHLVARDPRRTPALHRRVHAAERCHRDGGVGRQPSLRGTGSRPRLRERSVARRRTPLAD